MVAPSTNWTNTTTNSTDWTNEDLTVVFYVLLETSDTVLLENGGSLRKET